MNIPRVQYIMNWMESNVISQRQDGYNDSSCHASPRRYIFSPNRENWQTLQKNILVIIFVPSVEQNFVMRWVSASDLPAPTPRAN